MFDTYKAKTIVEKGDKVSSINNVRLAKDGKKIQSVADVDFADLRLLAYAPDGASYEYYTDDGETKDYDKPEHFVHITLDADGNAKSDRATVKVEG